MQYQVLILDVPINHYHAFKHRFIGMDVNFTIAHTAQNAAYLCTKQIFHLIILKLSDFTLCRDFFTSLRRVNFAPAIVLVDKYDVDHACDALQSGADLCISTDWPIDLVADHVMAQFRRYASYSQYMVPSQSEHLRAYDTKPFQLGDIYIDPPRHAVEVQGRPVSLRPREFSLLLYFMQNPHIILSAGQICENAWGTDGIYDHGIAQPIRILRQAIEPDPQHPIYIETVRLVGYRFTAKSVERC